MLGQAAARVLDHPVEVVTTQNVLAEVEEYLPILADRFKVDLEKAEKGFRLLKLRIAVQPRAVYEAHLEEAERRIAHIDPDDVELLALTLALKIPLWTNDKDFDQAGIEGYTTARLLAKLGVFGQ